MSPFLVKWKSGPFLAGGHCRRRRSNLQAVKEERKPSVRGVKQHNVCCVITEESPNYEVISTPS